MSEEVKDLIRGLLVANPKKRLTASDALKHPWMVNMKKLNEAKSKEDPNFNPQ